METMITEEQKHLADIFKIAGFALMTPLGRIVLNIPEFNFTYLNIQYIIFALVSLALFYLGIIFMLKSIEKVTERRTRKWIQ